MFSGIVEQTAKVIALEESGTNVVITFETEFDEPLYIDQSIAHNGVCLTVIEIEGNQYKVDAIKQTLDVSNLGGLKVNDPVNVERCLKANARLDGHIVQGHVDGTAILEKVEDVNGSWNFRFKFPSDKTELLIPKGSVTINGISLTVAELTDELVTVSIIPYTYEHTNMHSLEVGDTANIEYDLLGKYVIRYMQKIKS